MASTLDAVCIAACVTSSGVSVSVARTNVYNLN